MFMFIPTEEQAKEYLGRMAENSDKMIGIDAEQRWLNNHNFNKELNKVERKGMKELMDFLKTSDFYEAPSSTRFHLSVPGGLVQHSLNVYEVMKKLLRKNENGEYCYEVSGKVVETITEENLIIMTLLHDVCKTFFYIPTVKWRKDGNNQWQSYMSYEIKDLNPLGHGDKSVYILNDYIKLEPCELYAIKWHMGFQNEDAKVNLQNAVEKHPIIWALHTADMLASSVMETNSSNKEEYR